jgi:serine O-acetyltransferase
MQRNFQENPLVALRYDIKRVRSMVKSRNPLVRLIYPYTCAGVQMLILHRLLRWNMYTRIPVLYQILSVLLKITTSVFQITWGIMISSHCDIGRGLYIAHHGGIWIGVKSMGTNCNVSHGVTIGRTEKESGYPIIGNNVYFGTGCMVIGNIKIGDNVKIGPYAVVRKDVLPNTVVMASPPRSISIKLESSETDREESV